MVQAHRNLLVSVRVNRFLPRVQMEASAVQRSYISDWRLRLQGEMCRPLPVGSSRVDILLLHEIDAMQLKQEIRGLRVSHFN